MASPTEQPIKEPNSPATSAGLSIGSSILIILSGVATIWTCFNRGGLTEVYNWLNSIPGAPFLALISLGLATGWRSFKNWRDKKRQVITHEALHVLTGATSNAELNAIVKEAAPSTTTEKKL